MLDVAVPEIGLERPGIVTFVGKSIAAGVPVHVRVRFEAQFGLDPCPLHHVGKAR